MIKKNYIGLSILLLVLLLGLSSDCYALTWESVRDSLNSYTGNNIGVARFKLALNNTTQYNKLVNNWDISAYDTIIYCSTGTATNDYANDRLIICNNNGKIYKQSNEQIVRSVGNFDCLNSKIYSINQSVNELMYVYESITSSFFLVNGNYNRNFILTDGEIYNSSNLNSPATSIEIIGIVPSTLGFTFIQASSNTRADVGDFEDIPFYTLSGDNDLYLGQLVVPQEYVLSYRTFSNFYWKYNNWQVRELGKVTYLQYSTTINNETYYDVYLYNKYTYENTIYSLYWTDDTQEPFALAGTNFYIANRYTSIVDGALNPFNTFSGDYYNEYNDILDNQEDVSNIVAGTEPILDFLTNSNIPSGEEPTFSDLPSIEIEDDSEEFFTWLLSRFLNVLNNNSNTNLSIPLFGNDYTIPSNFFVLNIEPLRTFINLGWWFICGVPFLKFIRSSIEKLKGGNIPLADEKSDLLGHII